LVFFGVFVRVGNFVSDGDGDVYGQRFGGVGDSGSLIGVDLRERAEE